MNAYELADALAVESSQMEYGYVVDDWELLDKSAQMLRQQADRIAELEKQLKHYKMAWNMAENELENQTKPLSDEEIEQIAKQHLAAYAQFIGAGEVCYEGEIEFARAIEERHGIK